jgi:coenzyme F420-0:L-glutamate ligase/coenzyme F420-1:gamma-L-glutamate ligase
MMVRLDQDVLPHVCDHQSREVKTRKRYPDRLSLQALTPFPLIQRGDDLASLVIDVIEKNGIVPIHGDVLVLAQKVVSKAEGRYLDLDQLEPSPQAIEIANCVKKDAKFVEAVLRESRRVVRQAPDVLIVEHRLGYVMANAGIDRSNVDPRHGSKPALLLPQDPDASAARVLARLAQRFQERIAVVISDSFGRPWRRGTVGIALGSAGLPALRDLRGRPDLYGRALRVTESGFADEIAAAASLLMGQSDEGQPAVLVRGLHWDEASLPAASLVRPPDEDLFR